MHCLQLCPLPELFKLSSKQFVQEGPPEAFVPSLIEATGLIKTLLS
jgi:hypothetical protein